MSYKPYYLKDVIDNSNKELFTVISTFAGGGGSSTGYRLAGGKILCVNEFVEAAVETYKANYPNTPVLVEDIKKLNGEDFLKAAGIQER
jgi:DNA (cytosine-5)-methyltransferase 1